jgi:hypothetical protein
LLPGIAHAYRPFDGTDADVAEPGEFELEIGPSYQAGRHSPRSLTLPSTVLNFGIQPGWELVIDGKGLLSLDREAGESAMKLTDTDVLLKRVLRRGSLQGEDGLSIATEFGTLIPTEADRRFGAIANLITSQMWRSLALHLNTAGSLTREGTFNVLGGLIVEGPRAFAIRPVAEVFVEHTLRGESSYSSLVGGIWEVSDHLALDCGIRGAWVTSLGVVEEARIGLTWNVHVLEIASPTPAMARAAPMAMAQ